MRILVFDSDKCFNGNFGCPYFRESDYVGDEGFCVFGGKQRELKSLNMAENGCPLPDWTPD